MIMNNGIKYDIPRFDEMQQFLNFIYTIGVENPNININKSIVYNELCRCGLTNEIGSSDGRKYCGNYFNEWKKYNERNGNCLNGLSVIHKQTFIHFLQYLSTNSIKEFDKINQYIKLYIPISEINLYDSVNTLFDFITREHINHCSKVADRIRSDNVVIRLSSYDVDSAIKIINFVNSNLKKGKTLNKTNPFVPTIHGIGFTYDIGNSYNSDIALVMSEYIKTCINDKTPPTIMDFYKSIKESFIPSESKHTFMCAMGEIRKIGYYIEKLVDIPIIDEVNESNDFNVHNDSQKEDIFLDAVIMTYRKYGFNQVKTAIIQLINNDDYGYFTNGDKGYRKKLMACVNKDDVYQYVLKIVGRNNNAISSNVVDMFCYKILGRELIDKINKACLYTLSISSERELRDTLKNAILWNSFDGFQNDQEINYQKIMKTFSGKNIWELIKRFLGFMIVEDDYNYLDELLEAYIRRLSFHLENSDISNKKNK